MIDPYHSPATFAKYTARYIADPTRVHAMTLREFGRSPSIERIIEFRNEAKRQQSLPVVGGLHERHDKNARYAYQREEQPEPEPEAAPAFTWVEPEKPVLTWKEIATRVATSFGYTLEDITGRAKPNDIVGVRHLIYVLLIERGNSRAQIGGWLNRDHASIIHAKETFPERIKRNPTLCAAYERFKREFGQ